MSANKPKFVYVVYIATSPEKVWQALTNPDVSEKYWFGYRVQADGKAGEHMTAINPVGRLAHDDPIIESDPPRRLIYGWQPLYEHMPQERPSRRSNTKRGSPAASIAPWCRLGSSANRRRAGLCSDSLST